MTSTERKQQKRQKGERSRFRALRSQPSFLKTWLTKFRTQVNRVQRQSMIDELDLTTVLLDLNDPGSSEYAPLIYLTGAQALAGRISPDQTNLVISEIGRHFTLSIRTVERDVLTMEALLVKGQRAWEKVQARQATQRQSA